VTGSGIGLPAAAGFARLDASVRFLGRTAGRAEEAARLGRHEGRPDVDAGVPRPDPPDHPHGGAGADTIVWLGAAPEAIRSTGELWHDRHPRPFTYAFGAGADDDHARTRLWQHVTELAG
jgi:NAD(P)-dependent dehydrogenase (short-subunit alcohol dehydrogenase family)